MRPKYIYTFRTSYDYWEDPLGISLKSKILQCIANRSHEYVWTPVDFINLGNRDAIDKVLQRLVQSQELRRIDRGLYDQPRVNLLTGQKSAPDYRKVIDAISRRDQVRVLVDGMTCANDLGLTNAVPGQVIIHTDAQLRPIQLDKLTIKFKLTSPSKLYWASRPAMRVVQALYWLHDALNNDNIIEQGVIKHKLIQLLQLPVQGNEICDDLQNGLHTLPSWMQMWVRGLLVQAEYKIMRKPE